MDRTTRRYMLGAIVCAALLSLTIPWYIGWTFGPRGAVAIGGMGIGVTWHDPAANETGFDPERGFHLGNRQGWLRHPLLGMFHIYFDTANKQARLPLWPIPLALAVAAYANILRNEFRNRRGACEGCGYRPDALVHHCPECGAVFPSLECLLLPSSTTAPSPITIRPARTPAYVAAFRGLCLEYAKSLEYTGECKALESQCFETEMDTLPGLYGLPRGEILLAFDSATSIPIGCVAIRPLSETTCEMKRMFTRAEHRSRGVGRLLATAVIAAARERRYSAMRLDTGATMRHAAALYQALGFRDIPAYNRDPVPGTRWMELTL